jgi:hypothetical protein
MSDYHGDAVAALGMPIRSSPASWSARSTRL